MVPEEIINYSTSEFYCSPVFNVRFSQDFTCFKDLTFTPGHGEKTALFPHSGAGKKGTCINLPEVDSC